MIFYALKMQVRIALRWASNYSSRYRPAEVLIHNGEAHLIRKRETFEDIINNQVEIEF